MRSSGECRCANNQPPFRTRDGLVCLNYGFCPLNGNNPKFRIENQVQQCYGGADATCEAIGALAYDCVCDSEDCTSYCKQTCNRGLPLYRDRTMGVKQEPVYCKSADNGCTNPNYVCTAMGTLQQCCPTFMHICSRNGAVPTEVYNTAGGLPTEYFDVGVPDVLCSAGEPLKDTSGERNMECSPSGSGSNSCPSTHSCEATTGSTTFGGICCPKPQYVCKLPREQGNCGTYSNRWWFNAKTGNCEEFIYSGCQGNANNFESYKECQDYCRDAKSEPQCIQGTALTDSSSNFIICGGAGASAIASTCPANYYCYYDGTTYGCCPTQAYTCSLPAKGGAVCGPSVTRWFYDSTQRACQTFSFNGCDGNSNNFATQQDCKDYCRVESCPDGGEVWKEPNGAVRPCTTNRQCPSTHYCTPVTVFSGTVYQTKSLCCPSKNFVCSQPKDQGVRCSSTRITRHSFNADTKTCQPFEYNGCEGNRNNFATQKACQNYCLSEACSPGTVVARDSDRLVQCTNAGGTGRISGGCPDGYTCFSRLVQCTNAGGTGRISGGCPDGYTCFSSPLLDQNVCCGASTELQSLCPASSAPFISALSLQPMQCTPNVDGSCPGNFFCWFSTTTTSVNAFYCCRSPDSIETGYCPPQLVPVPGEGAAQYRYCSPSAPINDGIQGCGINRHCQYSTTLERYICCGLESDVRLPNVCPPQPANLVPVELAGNYRTCNPYARIGTPQACPENSACLYTGQDNGFICCRVQLQSSPFSARRRLLLQ
uniref:Kunitz/Bovine pancreatic trypsin inhibitor domain protein n=1 Tax=Globodera pallida TaxID=36090 RepID=A0A183BM22_GLOPA